MLAQEQMSINWPRAASGWKAEDSPLSMREGFGASSQSGGSWPNTYWCKMEFTPWLTWAAVLALQLQVPPPTQSTAPGHVMLILHTLLQNISYMSVAFCYYVRFGTYYDLHHKLHCAAYIWILHMTITKEY